MPAGLKNSEPNKKNTRAEGQYYEYSRQALGDDEDINCYFYFSITSPREEP